MLNFSPLSWIFHDNWQFKETILTKGQNGETIPVTTTYDHAGHIHFFMTDYNSLKNARQQAYSGSQEYSFTIEDVWGPNSKDPNQTHSYKLIGKPRWYFYIEEYWRRVYIQPWEQEDYENKYPNHPERIGIKYDASKPEHSFGPFREGGGLFFFNPEINRTLPIEYWLNEEKTTREHFLRKKHYAWDETKGTQVWNYEKNKRQWTRMGRNRYYYNWEGDNAFYDYDKEYGYEFYAGFNKLGDIVCVGSGKNRKFFRNNFIPSRPVASMGENYYPNPTPGASIETLRNEFLIYYDFESTYGDTYTKEYSNWLTVNNKKGSNDDFRQFIDLKSEEFQRNCFTAICPNCNSQNYIYTFKNNDTNELYGHCYNCGHETFLYDFHNFQNLKYEFIDFDDFCLIWEELSKEEIIKQGLLGDYPLQKDDVEIPNIKSEFGDESEPFRKNNIEVNPYDVYKKYFENREEYTIPRGREATGNLASETHPRETSFTDEDGARRFYSDNLYIHPVIEYQKVVHLNYERLPERAAAESNIDIWTDISNNFGDGFSVNVSIPFRVNGIIQSPFSDDAGIVYPPGNYFHNFKDENKLRYSLESYGKILELDTKESDVDSALEVVKKYRKSEYLKFMKKSPDLIGKINWFNENYANRPILMNDEEGMFDEDGNWIEIVTHDRPRLENVIVKDGKPTLESKPVQFSNPGFKEDGLWVEQCLGAKVIPKIELVFEDALGHRFTKWVDSIEASSSEPFIGISK